MNDVIWKPSQEILKNSNIARFMRKHGIATYEELHHRSVADIAWFWNEALKDIGVEWFAPYSKVYDMSAGFPWTRWFIDGKINIVHNCIDRHSSPSLCKGGAGRVDHVLPSPTAIIGEGDDGQVRTLTYQQLHDDVCKLANALKRRGIGIDDSVGIYMPMVPEVVVALFACLKIGAVAIPIFSGFGPDALAVRLNDAKAKVLLTADGGFRRGKWIPIKSNADEALKKVSSIKHVMVFDRKKAVWQDAVNQESPHCPTEVLDAEATSLIIYTSGTTGKPKGCVHTHAGALAQIGKELCYAFDVKPGEPFFWFTDIGWMMGPWEMIGVLLLGGTMVIFEAAPDYPDAGRVWQLIERHRIATLGISPTAIRLLKRSGDEWPKKYDLSSLKILGSTGETWDPESYQWFFENVGQKRCPIINISGGTEIIGCHLSPLPITELKSCTLRGPGLGMDVDVFDDQGKSVRGEVGHLVCKQPAPSMTKGFLGDKQRYLETYFSKFGENIWYHGDWASIDHDGFWFLHGRSDDTIKVAGKRTGPAEIEAALLEHEAVAEAAAIGVPHEIKGETVVCFVVLAPNISPSEELRAQLKDQVVKALGKTLRPEEVKFVEMLPKTRSAKILRGLIRKIYLGEPLGDMASVENPASLDAIRSST
ncbi:MAG: AMP-binding protein [Deltaproteobacteria bacterium]|nr:AMP-binding protein [Deltaproteobacteria bacterium]